MEVPVACGNATNEILLLGSPAAGLTDTVLRTVLDVPSLEVVVVEDHKHVTNR